MAKNKKNRPLVITNIFRQCRKQLAIKENPAVTAEMYLGQILQASQEKVHVITKSLKFYSDERIILINPNDCVNTLWENNENLEKVLIKLYDECALYNTPPKLKRRLARYLRRCEANGVELNKCAKVCFENTDFLNPERVTVHRIKN